MAKSKKASKATSSTRARTSEPKGIADQYIDQVERIRRKNNLLWMDILRLAIDTAPAQSRLLLAQINDNDTRISRLLGKLSKT